MNTFINLLIGLLMGLILCHFLNFRIREGQGPMVGSIMFPTSYKGITDVLHKEIKVKEDNIYMSPELFNHYFN